MKIAIGSDHRGFLLKEKIKKFLKRGGHSIYDAGCSSNESVDYPVFAEKVGKAINKNQAEKGILICGSGIGMSIAVNKIPNIRGALVRSAGDAESGVRHNNANVITIGADTTNFLKAKKIIKTFLNSEFEGGRHSRRVEIIKRIESGK